MRFNGINQQQFVVTDPAILNQVVFAANGTVSNVPSIQSLTEFCPAADDARCCSRICNRRTRTKLLSASSGNCRYKTTLSATYTFAQTKRLLRSRNINAPVGGVRPNPAAGNIFQYESTGRFTQNQMIFNFRSNFSEAVSLFGNYAFGAREKRFGRRGNFSGKSI